MTDHRTARDVHAVATRRFVEELLRSGLALSDLCGELLDQLDGDPVASADVLLDLVAGTLQPVTAAAGPAALEAATDLIGASFDRVLEDLRAAAELAATGPLH